MSISRLLANASLKSAGWKFEGEAPREKRYVALAVPHTTNWDGPLLLLLARSIDLPIRWMVKDSLAKGPLGPPIRWLGAVPIDRSKRNGMVQQAVEYFRTSEQLALFIPPEGTRSRTDGWKSGFYHIALGADVPVVPSYLDFARRRAGLGPAMRMTGNVREDMDRLRAFYAKMNAVGLHPEKTSPIRLREEDEG